MDLSQLLSIDPFHWRSVFVAAFCGTIIGLERQLRGKPVGIRTASLIVLGTYLFVAATNTLTSDSVDPSRIIGQVVTGVGFLGAGVMMAKDGAVVGVTSAATIWVLAAIGVSIGVGGEWVAIKLSILVVLILWGVDLLEDYSSAFTRGVHQKYNHWKTKFDRRQN